ncbi:hypothetical protein AWZ03_007339 [Drosophila navojoa]|uniref:Uncharacterized protein n=1 Tax=Drosophila navojoa TaxID=7232 RepID=A0A484BBS6_DRONA|nr:hypothetical protein AWZ03_007339 [Drosophila navojoa]
MLELKQKLMLMRLQKQQQQQQQQQQTTTLRATKAINHFERKGQAEAEPEAGSLLKSASESEKWAAWTERNGVAVVWDEMVWCGPSTY